MKKIGKWLKRIFPLVFENSKIVLNYQDENKKVVEVSYLWSEEENRFVEK